jgi:hypothetical protein
MLLYLSVLSAASSAEAACDRLLAPLRGGKKPVREANGIRIVPIAAAASRADPS